mmetsp:Transcript_36694/g.67278  ORF Transcript_36694/g.67278 Transcript_36694/m.67278 type:complete len:236 (+) Transcript_36694:59-766(+)
MNRTTRRLRVCCLALVACVCGTPGVSWSSWHAAGKASIGARQTAGLRSSRASVVGRASHAASASLGSAASERRSLLLGALGGIAMVVGAQRAVAAEGKKLRNLPASEMAEIVRKDLVEKQFLATADFTPEIYDDSCTFTDEIDTYPLDKFIKGTKALFVGSESQVNLVGKVEPIDGGKAIQFRFDETLAFNFPFVHPKVRLSGVCTLTRGADGLITSYREKWDQSIPEVLSTARL